MSNSRRITLTAILLALALLFQNLRLIPFLSGNVVSLFTVGTLLNFTLILAVYFVGFWGALLIAVITPVVAFFQGHLAFPQLILPVAIGNAVFPLTYSLLHNKFKLVSEFLSVIIGSLIKFLALYFTIPWVFNAFISSTIPAQKASILMATLSFNFSWPQLVTALAGGFLAIIIGRSLEAKIKEQ